MLVRGAKYFVPIGIAVFTPSIVFAAETPNAPSKQKRAPWDVYCDAGQPPAKEKKECTKKPAVAELEKCIAKCREDFAPIQSDVNDYISQTKTFFKDTTSAVVDNVKFLQNDASDDVKMSTIAGGTVLGFLLGFRKSFFKKLLYAAIGGGTTAAIIYPKETKVIVKEGSVYARTTIKSAYNQLLGPPADDKQTAKCDSKQRKSKNEKGGGKNTTSTSAT